MIMAIAYRINTRYIQIVTTAENDNYFDLEPRFFPHRKSCVNHGANVSHPPPIGARDNYNLFEMAGQDVRGYMCLPRHVFKMAGLFF